MAAQRLELSWLDVFTDRAFGGNPLAVVYGADALPAQGMQGLAAEFGLSETVFALEGGTRLRIFTPMRELPLAGHPVVGAALDLARRGLIPDAGTTTFATGAGPIPVELSRGTAMMTQSEPEFGPDLPAARIAPLIGLEAKDLLDEPGVCDTAFPFVICRVRDREALAALQPDLAGIAAIEDPALALLAWCEDGPGRLRQRMFGPRIGVAEDPATGAAAGALCALRVLRGAEPGRVSISQGEELGRPSAIEVEVGGSPGAPTAPRVGGRAVLVMEGTLDPGAVGA